MKIKVIGKSRVKGTAKKTGNPYDCVVVHYTGPARGVEGEAAQTVWLDAATYPYDTVFVGSSYNAEFDNRGYVVGFDLIPNK